MCHQKYFMTSNVRYNEKNALRRRMCVIANDELSSVIALVCTSLYGILKENQHGRIVVFCNMD